MDFMCCAEGDQVGGQIIASLKPGDEIVIPPGAGDPARKETVTDHVLQVRGCSALTIGGVRLECKDGRLIQKTGKSVPIDQLEVSEKASMLWIEANSDILLFPSVD